MTIEWGAYRTCPVCRVGLGKPCLVLSRIRPVRRLEVPVIPGRTS